jgi:hypothetical protein
LSSDFLGLWRRFRKQIVSPSIVGLLLAASPQANAAGEHAGDQPARFQAWAKAAAKTGKLVLCRWGSAQYDQQAPARFAIFRQASEDRWAVVVAWAEGSRAYLSDPDPVQQTDCPGEVAPAWEKVKLIEFPAVGMTPKQIYRVALVADDLVLLNSHANDHNGNDDVDWVQLSERHSDFGAQKEKASAILPVLDPASPWVAGLPKSENFVTFSRSREVKPDAAVNARLSLVGSDLRIELGASDDTFLPPATAAVNDRDFLKRDHFELWFCAPGTAPTCDKKSVRQLGVARTADGKAHTRWLLPRGNKAKLPEATTTPAPGPGVIVNLPLALIAHAGDAAGTLEGKLTVAYSDADQTAEGQKTVVATSDLRWGASETFGRFVRQQDGARFPPWTGSGAFERDNDFLNSLPRLPDF